MPIRLDLEDGNRSNDIIASAPPESAAHLGVRDISWQALGPAIAFTILSTSVVALRWYTRCKLVRCRGWDDWVVLVSLALTWAMTAIIGAEVNEGVGVMSGRDVHPSDIAKLVVANNILWALTTKITKVSILLQYLRIFSSRTVRWLCYLLMFLTLPSLGWAVFGGTFLCRPVAKLWEPRIPGHCMSAQRYWLSAAGINIIMDFFILALPMPAVTSLRLPRKQKFAVLLVFLLGFFVSLVSIVRLVTVYVTAQQGNFVASGIWAITWSAIEANVGIICASLLALKPLIATLCPNLMEDNSIPEHCMRLPMVENATWQHGDSDKATLCQPRGGSMPTTPTTNPSKGSVSTFKRPSDVRITSHDQSEMLDLFDMLAMAAPGEQEGHSGPTKR